MDQLFITQANRKKKAPGLNRLAVAVFFSSAFLGGNTQAQTQVQAPSMQGVLQAVMAKQPEQMNVQSYASLVSSNQAAARSWFPNGSSMSVRHESDALTDDTGFQSWEAGVSFPVLIGDQSNAYSKLGEVYQQQSEQYRSLLNWQASKLTRQLVWDLKLAEVQWHRSQQNQGLVAALVNKVEKLVAAGENPQMDAVLAQKRLLEVEKRTVEANNAYEQQLANYQFWTGFSELPSDIEEPEAKDWQAVRKQLESHPLMVWADSQLQKVQANKLLVQSQAVAKPSVFFGAKSEQDDQTAARTSLMLELSFPLGKPATYGTALAEQSQLVSEQQVALQKTKQSLSNNARQALQALEQSKALLNVAQQQVVVAKQALGMAEKAYELGETNIQTLLGVQRQMLQALLESDQQQVMVQRQVALVWQAFGKGIETAQAE
ncbi:TolC family protein [Thiomicrorhabdus sp. ZW0627]|uniref:TolC family protein n=1 Tax=Thiomicrorhabdus sp. ZW0627 TaxID=3039774 RepID=UPI0024366BD4|nr:TolC family protein [Thiomicrorhabdus sp. ZW0627]MDG6773446.1 TolC family protein [Thiomicrorhabdus sp. ZW0627]